MQPTTRGFTLIEIMVVLFIIGLASAVVLVNIPSGGGGKGALQTAEQMVVTIRHAKRQAVFNSRTLGVLIQAREVRFLQRDSEGWSEVDPEIIEADFKISSGIVLALEVGGNTLDLTESASTPQIFLLSDGQISPFVLRVREGENELLVDERLRLGADDSERRQ